MINENLFIFLFVFALIVIVLAIAVRDPTQKPTQQQSTTQRPTLQPRWRTRIYQYWWKPTKWIMIFVVGVVGLLASIYQVGGGPPWPADPEIHPRDTADGSSLILPFSVRNRSTLFDTNDVSMTCGIDLVAFSDANGHWAGADSAAFFTGVISIPANSSPVNYPCDASSLVQVHPDGSLAFRDTLSTGPSVLQAPIKILKMCVWVGGDYKIGPKTWSFTSNIFKWPASQTSHQWIEGPTATNQDRPKALPTNNFDDLECRPIVTGPYIYIKGFGPPQLLLDVRKRPR
jgi:hypothetical protein